LRLLSVSNRYPPWSRGGYETIAAAAARGLSQRGHDVEVLTTRPDPSDRPDGDPWGGAVRRELRWYWRDHRFPVHTLRETVSLERENAATLRERLESLAPDAVLWWAMGGMSLSMLEQVRRAGVPAVGVVGDDWLQYGPSVDAWSRRFRGPRRVTAPLASRVASIPAALQLDRAARWVFISEHLRTLAWRSGYAPVHSVIAHPGPDPERWSPRPAPDWGWRLLYCGRIDRRKGIATAIEALVELPEAATLTIDGSGDDAHAAELSDLAVKLGVSGRVRFQLSDYDAVPDAYAAADAIVFPITWQEPWGLVPLEAMAVGRPVVASRAGGGAAEYLVDAHNALQFEPGDARELAAAAQRLASDPGLREALRAGGRDTAARFTEAAFHAALEGELRAAVAHGPL
jgi:glycosyltransferase involved in cell wall biosynthesis